EKWRQSPLLAVGRPTSLSHRTPAATCRCWPACARPAWQGRSPSCSCPSSSPGTSPGREGLCPPPPDTPAGTPSLKPVLNLPPRVPSCLPPQPVPQGGRELCRDQDRKSTRLNSSHVKISYAVFCLK